jgi:hypothetical protein
MSWIPAVASGLLGSSVVEAASLAKILQSTKRWPWRSAKQRSALLAAMLLRICCGVILAGVLAEDGRIKSILAAFIVGTGAPTIVQRLAGVAWSLLTSTSPTVPKPDETVGHVIEEAVDE